MNMLIKKQKPPADCPVVFCTQEGRGHFHFHGGLRLESGGLRNVEVACGCDAGGLLRWRDVAGVVDHVGGLVFMNGQLDARTWWNSEWYVPRVAVWNDQFSTESRQADDGDFLAFAGHVADQFGQSEPHLCLDSAELRAVADLRRYRCSCVVDELQVSAISDGLAAEVQRLFDGLDREVSAHELRSHLRVESV